jgi:hypothetical protein
MHSQNIQGRKRKIVILRAYDMAPYNVTEIVLGGTHTKIRQEIEYCRIMGQQFA